MDFTFSDSDKAKYASAKYSLNFIEDGMRIGLGTGSTAAWFVVLLADFIKKNDINVTTVSTSNSTKILAETVGLRVVSLDEIECLDLTVDGADEFDQNLNLIKRSVQLPLVLGVMYLQLQLQTLTMMVIKTLCI